MLSINILCSYKHTVCIVYLPLCDLLDQKQFVNTITKYVSTITNYAKSHTLDMLFEICKVSRLSKIQNTTYICLNTFIIEVGFSFHCIGKRNTIIINTITKIGQHHNFYMSRG
jgi:hypothetical protein